MSNGFEKLIYEYSEPHYKSKLELKLNLSEIFATKLLVYLCSHLSSFS